MNKIIASSEEIRVVADNADVLDVEVLIDGHAVTYSREKSFFMVVVEFLVFDYSISLYLDQVGFRTLYKGKLNSGKLSLVIDGEHINLNITNVVRVIFAVNKKVRVDSVLCGL